MKTKNLNSLLVEILMAMLFFALSAAVILQTFVTARSQSDRAILLSEALLAAQNLADEAILADDISDCTIAMDGFTLTLTTSEEAADAGILRRAEISAQDENGETLLTLPAVRYLSDGEVRK